MAHTIRARRLKSPLGGPMNHIAKDIHVIMPTIPEKIASYADLRKLIRVSLRIQNPEWIGIDGESEMCEFYEARFAKLIDRFSGESR
jgi:hypothetical protein